MLPPFIIEQIRKREEEERQEQDDQRPRLELPLPMHAPQRQSDAPSEPGERGVVIIDLM